MAVLVIGDVAGGSAEGDAAIVDTMRVTSDPPAGMLYRVSGPSDAGWRIVTLWDSRDAWDAFFQERVAPVLEERGLSEPEFEYWPIESVIAH